MLNLALYAVITMPTLPRLDKSATSFPIDGAVRIVLEEGVPIFRVSSEVQVRIEELLSQQTEKALSAEEERELDSYEEIDDYLSFVNRTIRNISIQSEQQSS